MTINQILSPEIVVLVVFVGFLIGIIAALGGIGGGALIVPFFLLLFEMDPSMAKGTSLFMIFMSSSIALIIHNKNQKIYWRVYIVYAFFSILGSIFCSFIQNFIFIERSLFYLIFGLLEFLISLQLISKLYIQQKEKKQLNIKQSIDSIKNNTITKEELIEKLSKPGLCKKTLIFFFFAGFLSTFLGIGGGVINSPVLLGIVGLPIHYATAGSTCIIFFTSTYNVIFYGVNGFINWNLGLIMGIGMILGSRTGAKYASRVPKTIMLGILIVLLLFTGTRLYLQFLES